MADIGQQQRQQPAAEHHGDMVMPVEGQQPMPVGTFGKMTEGDDGEYDSHQNKPACTDEAKSCIFAWSIHNEFFCKGNAIGVSLLLRIA